MAENLLCGGESLQNKNHHKMKTHTHAKLSKETNQGVEVGERNELITGKKMTLYKKEN